jgi:hypothetical protein
MPHSVKIEDKTYEKLSLYCKDNGVKISDFCNRAIKDALMMKMYGDAPFYFYKQDTYTTNEIGKNAEKEKSALENLENSGMASLDSIKSDEEGNVEIHMKKLNGINGIQTKFTVHNDGTVEFAKDNKDIEEQEKPLRPRKRRL